MRFSALKKISKHKKPIALVLAVLTLSLFIAPIASAGFSDWAGEVVGGIIYVFIWALGLIVLLVMKVLLVVVSYQHFIDAQAVIQGWVIVRDIANMFFVVILLVIAFATILHIEEYSYKKWLPKLILMAVLINFSKTICGLLIDVAQVVMLTFVNSFRSVAGGNFVDMLGITDVVTFAKSDGAGDDVGFWTIVGAYILGLMYMIIALVVLTTMLMILVMRLVMIWIYVVLSPLAYLLSAFPGGAKYASKWWTDFTSNLIVGPVLAFFIWLSFAALQTSSDVNKFNDAETGESGFVTNANSDSVSGLDDSTMVTKASTPSVLIKFIIGIGMLIGGMKIAQEVGGAAGSIAGKGMSRLNKIGTFAAGAAGGFALSKAKFAGRTALGATAGITKGIGTGLSKATGGKFGTGMQKAGDIGMSWRRDLMDSNKKNKIDKRKKFLDKIGVGPKTADKINTTYGKDRKEQEKVNSKSMMVAGAAMLAPLGPVAAILGALGGRLASIGVSKVAEKRDEKIKNSKTALQGARDDYNTALAIHGSETHPSVVIAKNNVDMAKDNLDTSEGEKLSLKSMWNLLLNQTRSLNEASTKFTAAGAKKLAEVENNARARVSAMAKDPTYMDDASASAFSSSTGQTEDQEAFVRHLSGTDADAVSARANMEAWLNAYSVKAAAGTSTPKEDGVVRAVAKGIAATQKKGDVDTSNLSKIINSINTPASVAKIGGTVDSFRDAAIPYRHVNSESGAGSGALHVNSMAKGKKGHEVAGVDFNNLKQKLEGQGVELDASADGAYIAPENMAAFGTAFGQIIDEERAKLESKKKEGKIKEDDYQKQSKTLDAAQNNLNDGRFKDTGISLVNSASANFGRKEALATAYHEDIHKGGVKDEALTEDITQVLQSNKLYGRNNDTGNTHVSEIAAMAKAMKDGGSNNADILRAVSTEVAKRSSKEGSNAEKAVNKETGKTQTESAYVKESGLESIGIQVDTKKLEQIMSKLKMPDLKSLDSNASLKGVRMANTAGINRLVKAVGAKKEPVPMETAAIVHAINENKEQR